MRELTSLSRRVDVGVSTGGGGMPPGRTFDQIRSIGFFGAKVLSGRSRVRRAIYPLSIFP